MGLRFRKSLRIVPGLKLNISKSGLSASLGGKGLTHNRKILGHARRSRSATTVGLPGTGVSYRVEGEGGTTPALTPVAPATTPPASGTTPSGRGASNTVPVIVAVAVAIVLALVLF